MDADKVRLLQESGIDYEAGIERFGGNTGLFEKFIFRFPEDAHYKELHEALAQGDAEAGFRAAHTLKGVVGNLSFVNYYAAISPVAEYLKEGKLSVAQDRMEEVDLAHEQVMQTLTKIT